MKKFGKLAVLAALVLAAACFVSCSNSSGGGGGGSGEAMTASVELTGTTDPVFANGTKSCKDNIMYPAGTVHCEITISGKTANLKWVEGSNHYAGGRVYVYESAKFKEENFAPSNVANAVGYIDFVRNSDKNHKDYFKAEWKLPRD